MCFYIGAVYVAVRYLPREKKYRRSSRKGEAQHVKVLIIQHRFSYISSHSAQSLGCFGIRMGGVNVSFFQHACVCLCASDHM